MGLAIDEALLHSFIKGISPNTVRFYYFSRPSVVIGLNQDINDVNLKYIQENNIIGITFLLKLDSEIPSKLSRKFKFFSSIIMNAFENIGLRPEYNKNSDITINGKKIAGNGIYLRENVVFFHSMILFDFDFNLMLNVLRLDKTRSKDELLQVMKDKITTLKIEKNQEIQTEVIEDEIINSIKSNWEGITIEDHLSDLEKSVAIQLYRDKYTTDV
jgi:lipoate-protein ligase A